MARRQLPRCFPREHLLGDRVAHAQGLYEGKALRHQLEHLAVGGIVRDCEFRLDAEKAERDILVAELDRRHGLGREFRDMEINVWKRFEEAMLETTTPPGA